MGAIDDRNIAHFTASLHKNMAAIRARGCADLSNVVMIGDSFLGGDGLSNPSTYNWGDLFATNNGLKNYRCYANGGAGYISTGNANNGGCWSANGGTRHYINTPYAGNFKSLIGTRILPNETAPEAVTAVIVVGGVNDGNQPVSVMQSAVAETVAALHNAFPAAQIYLIASYNAKLSYESTLSGLFWGAQDCPYAHVTIKSSTWLTAASVYQSDDLHPTDYANVLAVRMIDNFVRYGVDNGLPYRYKNLANGVLLSASFDGLEMTIKLTGYATGNGSNTITISEDCPRQFRHDADSTGSWTSPFMWSSAGPFILFKTGKKINLLFSSNVSGSINLFGTCSISMLALS